MLQTIIVSILVILGIYLLIHGLFRLRLFREKRRLNAMVKHLKNNQISKITDSGFVYLMHGNKLQIKWKDVEKVVLEKHRVTSVELKSKVKYDININEAVNLRLLKKIPKNVEGYNYDFVENFFRNLSECEVCGLKSIMKDECWNCSYAKADEIKYEGTKLDYLKEEQLDYLSVHFNLSKIEKIVEETQKHDVFYPVPNWKILISQGELDKENEFFNK